LGLKPRDPPPVNPTPNKRPFIWYISETENMREEIRNKLKEEGYDYNLNPDGYYIISPTKRINLPIKVQLVESKPINEIIHGSQNGNEIDAIGYFRFKLETEEKPDIIIFL